MLSAVYLWIHLEFIKKHIDIWLSQVDQGSILS